MVKHIGIVAVSPEGSAICYRAIGRRVSEIEDPRRRPLVSLHNRPFSHYVAALERGDWPGIADMLRQSAAVLAHAGAEFCILPDNVAHHALPMAEGGSPVPWLNMIDLTADAVQSNGCRRIGLIGTKYVTYGSTYQTVLGLRGMHLLVPPQEEADFIDRVIFNEAVHGRVKRESRARVLVSVRNLAERGCDGLILGATEAPLMLALEESPLPVFDPVELLAEAAIRHALSGAAQGTTR